ncbi:UNVERIFIED_CONTAM: hypothetical protein GTU68_050619, partial [Idotea baltica]|nr:hypothetical protein [Idotea baltica]
QLQQGFIEIADRISDCKFRDCKHQNEPKCAILTAAKNGEIHKNRFESFNRIKVAIAEQKARGLTL